MALSPDLLAGYWCIGVVLHDTPTGVTARGVWQGLTAALQTALAVRGRPVAVFFQLSMRLLHGLL